jgi:hypothetical protein
LFRISKCAKISASIINAGDVLRRRMITRMMPETIRRALIPLLLLVQAPQTKASAVDPELQACILRNAAKTTAVQRIELRSTDRIGSEKILVADVYLKRFADETSGLIAYFKEPEDLWGTRLLVLEKDPTNEMYLYMPALFKIRRITSKRISSSMYGSDFSYEDIERVYGLLSSQPAERIADTTIDGESMYVLQTTPTEDAASKYESVISYFDKNNCVVRKVEFFEPGSRLRKVLWVAADKVRPVQDIRLPREYLMTDLRDKTETRMTIKEVRLDVPIPDRVFDHTQLKDFRGID